MANSGSFGGRLSRGARLVALGVAVAAASVGPAASAAAASPAAGLSIPWSKAGPGWSLVQYSNAKLSGGVAKGGTTTLYLVSPNGQRFAVHSWKNGAAPPPSLLDWSGDRQRVLLVQQVSPTSGARVEQVSLATGKIISQFTLPSLTEPIGYTKPGGLNLLTVKLMYEGSHVQLIRYNLAGVRQRVLATISSPIVLTLYAPDGTYLLASAPGGLSEISNLGGVIKRIHPAPAQAFCSPVRWWNPTTVLASCFRTGQDSAGRLWLFHLRTGRSNPLTAVTGSSQDTAWYISSGQFLQESASCFALAQVYRNGSIHRVPVPGNGSVQIVTAVGGRLLLTGRAARCDSSALSASLLWFSPKQHKVSYLIRPVKNVIGIEEVLPFGGLPVVG